MANDTKLLSISTKMDVGAIVKSSGVAKKALNEMGKELEKTQKLMEKSAAMQQQNQGRFGPNARKLQEDTVGNQVQQNQQKITEEVKYRKSLNDQLDNTLKQLKEIGEIEQLGLAHDKEKISAIEKRNELLEQEKRLHVNIRHSDTRFKQMSSAQQKMLKSDMSDQDQAGGKQDPESNNKMSKSSKALVSAIAGIGTTIAAMSKIYDQVATQDVRTTGREGAISTGAGQELSGIYNQSGQGWESMYYSPEKQSALQKAVKFLPGKRERVNAETLAISAGVGVGAGIFTTPLGGAVAGTGTLVAQMLDEEKRMAMFDKEGFDTMQAKKVIEDYRKTEASEKDKNFLKTRKTESYNKLQLQNQSMRRSMGYNEDDFKNDLLWGASGDYGGQFSQAELLKSSQSILSAGGSARAARDASRGDFAGYSRDMNQQNVGSVIGKISQTIDSGTGSQNAYKALLEEGIRNGLNTSDLNKSMEHYTQTMSDYLVGEKGLTDKNAIADLASQIKLGDTSKAGVEGGIGAFKKLSEMSGDMFTNISSMQNMRKLEGWDQLGGHMQNALGSMKIDDMNIDNEVIKAAASAMNQTPEQLVKGLRSSKTKGLHSRTMTTEQFDHFGSWQQQNKDLTPQQAVDRYREENPEQYSEMQGRLSNFLPGYKSSSPQEKLGIMMQMSDPQMSPEERNKNLKEIEAQFAKKDEGVSSAYSKGLGKEFTSSIGSVSGKHVSEIITSMEKFAQLSDKTVSNMGNFQAILAHFKDGGEMESAVKKWITGLDSMNNAMAKQAGQTMPDGPVYPEQPTHISGGGYLGDISIPTNIQKPLKSK